MAYGEGKSRLYKDIGQEEAFERGRYERELSSAEGAYEQDVESSNLWQALFGTVGAAAGFYLGGYSGALKGWQIGGETGRWGQRGFSGYDPEDYAISTDPGKFDVGQRYDFEDVNRQFEAADRSRLWKDITSTGTTFASMLAFGAKDDAWTKYLEGLEISEEVLPITDEQMLTYFDQVKKAARER
jgi:hypothetical protein